MYIPKSRELLDPEEVTNPIILVGLGALGSYIAQSLAKMGLTNVKFYDFDFVEEKNLNNQNYNRNHIGKTKAHASYLILHAINLSYKKTQFIEKKFSKVNCNREILPETIVIMAIDKGRKELHDWIKHDPRVKYIIEVGMAHDCYHIQVADKSHKMKMIMPTREEEENGGERSACGETLSICGGIEICAGQVSNELRKIFKQEGNINRMVYTQFYPYIDNHIIDL